VTPFSVVAYQASIRASRKPREGANIHRVVLENEFKAEYQEFLQERNRDRGDSDGRSDRELAIGGHDAER
jgi:hypothetical protein